ncbi:AAA family ATPase [Tolypothrix campylonemoides VB511288]|nr:AAA family ATPase [Tolypothrix campylonemoides VB511288]
MYQPLHLKYRPQTLSEVIGQEHIVRTLTNAILPGGSRDPIAHHKIAPTYLFNGPKGTGKTSTARIIAKSLNSHLAPRKFDGTSLLSMKPKVLYIARKANKNNVALLHIFLVCTVFYG